MTSITCRGYPVGGQSEFPYPPRLPLQLGASAVKFSACAFGWELLSEGSLVSAALKMTAEARRHRGRRGELLADLR